MISPRDIQHLARLARMELTPEEEQRFRNELSAILEFVEKLNEINTENVEPMTGGTTLENAMRPDEKINQDLELKAKNLVDAVPEEKEGWVRVKAVFE